MNTEHTAAYYLEKLALQPHPEGGFYKRSYESKEKVPHSGLPPRFIAARSISTAIYYLLEEGNYSAFHRIKSDELWHHYAGGTLLIHVINEHGKYSVTKLGKNLEAGEVLQFVVPAGCWFASEPAPGTAFVLCGCTVAPGFHFDDFEMATSELIAEFPHHAAIIQKLLAI